jgi:hypothetical protein
MKTVIEMVQDAGFSREHINTWMCSSEDIRRFAALVRADERKRFRIDDLEMLLKVRAEQIVSLQDEIRNLMGEE